MNNSINWHKLLLTIQAEMNMIISSTTKISSYEFMYKLKLLTFLNLIMKFLQITIYNVRMNAHKTIAYTAIKMKKMYDKNYKLIFFKSENKIIFKLHKKYIIIFVKILKFKFCQQYAEKFTVFERIKYLTYRLNLSLLWEIHLIINVTYLKSVSNENDFFKKQFHESDSIILDKGDFNDSDDSESFYEI